MFAIRANHAFDGEDFRAGGATVLLEDGRIVGVEPVAYEPPSDCELVDYGDATVLPGLIDTHVHLVGDSGVMALERAAGYSSDEIDRGRVPSSAGPFCRQHQARHLREAARVTAIGCCHRPGPWNLVYRGTPKPRGVSWTEGFESTTAELREAS
jgi:cytosine/adenosine deaminase-related metal-dependent hydrolase